MKILISVVALIFFTVPSFAKGKGGWSWGANFGVANTGQDDMNTLISRANTRTSGLSLSSLGNALEVNAFISYRTKSLLALQFRPSYAWQKETGSGHEYSISAITAFPVARFYMLESKSVKFFSQFGVGFGYVNGRIKENGGGSVGAIDFSGNSMGYMGGLGAEFCFGDHCINVEGNLRVLSVERVTSSDSGSGLAANGATVDGKEVELDSRDLSVSLSGVQGLVGYTMYF